MTNYRRVICTIILIGLLLPSISYSVGYPDNWSITNSNGWISLGVTDPYVGVYQGVTGYGVVSSAGDGYDLDGGDTPEDPYEALIFHVNSNGGCETGPVAATLHQIEFAGMDATDDFNLDVDGVTVMVGIQPNPTGDPGLEKVWVPINLVGSTFRIWADENNDNFRVSGIDVSNPTRRYNFDLDKNGQGTGNIQGEFSCTVATDIGLLVQAQYHLPTPVKLTATYYDYSGVYADPISTYTGEYFFKSEPDIALGGPMPISFSRYYASGLKTSGITGPLGDNWKHDFEWNAQSAGSDYEVHTDKGRSIIFHKAPATSRINSGGDDVEEAPDGSVDIVSSDLEMVNNTGNEPMGIQTVGLLFRNINVNQAEPISNASIQFTVDEISTGSCPLTIHGEAVDNPADFKNILFNASSRATTTSGVSWTPADWNTVGEAGPDQQTPDISSLIQEIVNRPGWVNGNNINIMISSPDACTRTAEAYDGVPGSAPTLSINSTFSSISAGNDDVEESADGIVDMVSSDLELVYDTGTQPNPPMGIQTVGLLFRSININQSEPITSSSIQFTVDEISTGTCPLTIHGEAVDNPVDFQAISFNATARTQTSASVAWSPPDWNTVGGVGPDQQTPDISPIIQEIVNRPGWVNGNSINIMISSPDACTRTAEAYDGVPASAATISINSTSSTISSGNDDIEEAGDGFVDLTSSDLELVYDTSSHSVPSVGIQTVGLLFRGVGVDQGETVGPSSIQFTVDEISAGTCPLMIHGEAADNPANYQETAFDLTSRILTTTSVSWSPPDWNTVGEAGPDQQTPDISPIIQEIVNRPGWVNGNSINIVISGTQACTRTAEAYNGVPGSAPELSIETDKYAPAATTTPYQLVVIGSDYVIYDPGADRKYTFDATGKLTKIEDTKGNSHTLSYDAFAKLTTVSDGLGRALNFTYNLADKLETVSDNAIPPRTVTFNYTVDDLTEVIDVMGNSTTFAYDPGALMTSKTLPETNVPVSQIYGPDGRVTSQDDSSSNTTTFVYDDFLGTTTITNALGESQVHSHTLVGTGAMDGSSDSLGNNVAIGSDSAGRRNSITDRLGGTTTTVFHEPSGKLASRTNADGSTTSYTYTPRVSGRITEYDLTGITHADTTTESFVYDGSGNPILHTDRAGYNSSATFHSSGQPLTTTNKLGGTNTYVYNPDGTVTTHEDPSGNTTTFNYDSFKRMNQPIFEDGSNRLYTFDDKNRLLTSRDEDGNTTTFTYDDNGNLTTIKDPLNKTISFSYDGNNRLISSTDPLGKTVTATYDAIGRPATSTDENNNTTTSAYDNLGRLASVTLPEGNSSSFTYNAEGVLNSATDGLGNTITFTSDSMGRRIQTTSPLGNVSSLSYDIMGKVVSTTAPLGDTITISRDIRGLISGTTLPGGSISTSLSRDTMGNIVQVTDPNGRNWLSSYNNQRQRISRTDPLNNLQTTVYDNRNRPATVAYSDGVIQTIGYDFDGDMTSRSYSGGGPVLIYSYDAKGRMTLADGISIAYDANNRIVESNGIVITRDPGGRIISMMLATGKSINYAYDSNDNLVSMIDWAGAVTSFVYDANDRLSAITRPAANGINTVYTYDIDGQLTGITEGAISSINLTRNGNGLITSATRTVPQSASAGTPSTVANSFDIASQISTAGFVYDVRGRLTDDGTRIYVWDNASRLISITEGETANYAYDALDQRLSRSSNGLYRSFVWNAALVLNSISIERDETATDLRYFIHTPDGALLYSVDAGSNARQFYHFDERGNTIAVTDDAGAVIGSYAYTPYGRITATSGSLDNPFTWQGLYGIMDEGNGLYYMRARYYNSDIGRFISRDRMESINPRSVNPYQYASANPMKFADPSGLEEDDLNNGMESMKKLAIDFFVGEAVGTQVEWLPVNVTEGRLKTDGELAKDVANEGLSHLAESAAERTGREIFKKAGSAVKLGELGAKIAIIISNAYQDMENSIGASKANLFMALRDNKIKSEARNTLYHGTVDNMSKMGPGARDMLRQMAVEPLLRVQLNLSYAKRALEKETNERSKIVLENQIKRIEERQWHFLNALAGKLVPGEDGYGGVWSDGPPNYMEATKDPALGKK